MMSDALDLPVGWALANVGDLADYINGRAFKPSEWKDSGKPIIRIQNLNKNDAKYNFSPVDHEEKYLVKNDDLLFAWSASLGVYLWDGGDAWLNQHIFKVLPKACTTKKFIFYLLEKITVELYAKAHGSGMVHVTKGKFESTEISLPPLAEQHRIVAKIEELFSELDKGIENLKAAQAQLKVYRQALLKHAFEGKLTAQWRTENQGKLETADALLKRIQHERAQRYQQQLAEWEASGKQGSKPKAPKTLPLLTAEELAELPSLPDGWIALSVESLFDIEDGDRGEHYPTKGDFSDGGHCLFLNAKNVTKRGFAFQEMSFISEKKDFELRKGKLKRGDIVFTSRGTLGNIAHYNDAIKHEHIRINSGMFIVRNYDISLTPDFLYYHLNAPIITSQIEKLQSGTAQPQLPIREFKSFRFVIPGKEEQQQIVQEMESKLSEVEQLDQTISTSLQRAEALRQSILKKAFSGQLVPQDPDDEPASELLARIKTDQLGNKIRAKS